MNKIFQLIACLIIPLLAGALGSLFTVPKIDGWYQTLTKPVFNAPNWAFAPVWNTLFILMGVALFLVIRSKSKDRQTAGYLFLAQLVINVCWSLMFFGLESPLLGLITIIVLWILIWFNIRWFYRINRVAGWLLVPYLLWVSFATVLNYAILTLN